jgi:hypothetical protein
MQGGRIALTPARLLFLALVCLAFVCPADAAADSADWPKLLFKTTSHDFGTVARGAAAEYRFEMENPYVEDVHVERIESTCGCAQPVMTKRLLKTYDTGEIVATLDTRRYYGQKDITIKVIFDQPFRAEYRLKLTSYIRPDVVFQPGTVQFGSVAQGQTVKKRVSVSYAGRAAWKVLEVGSDSPYLAVEMAEVERSADPRTNVGKVAYDLVVTLKEAAPAGYLKELVVLRTNDTNQQTARIPLTVEGLVVPAMSVHPAVIMFDVVRTGERVSKNLVVRGQKPFKITEVEGPDPRFHFTIPQAATQFKSADSTYYGAVIAVEFRAGDAPGKISGKVRIKTDLAGAAPLEVSVNGQVAAKNLEKIERAATRPAAKEPER